MAPDRGPGVGRGRSCPRDPPERAADRLPPPDAGHARRCHGFRRRPPKVRLIGRGAAGSPTGPDVVLFAQGWARPAPIPCAGEGGGIATPPAPAVRLLDSSATVAGSKSRKSYRYLPGMAGPPLSLAPGEPGCLLPPRGEGALDGVDQTIERTTVGLRRSCCQQGSTRPMGRVR